MNKSTFMYPTYKISYLIVVFWIMGWFLLSCSSEEKEQSNNVKKFSPALHFEELERQNREAADSLEALYDIYYHKLEEDSVLKLKGEQIRLRTETILQHVERTYYDLNAFLDNIPADKSYKEATVLFFVGKNKMGRGYELEKKLQTYVEELRNIDTQLNFTSPFASQTDLELLHDQNTDLVEAHFQKTFPEAAFTFLSALKKEIILIELQAIDELNKKRKR